MGKMNLLKASWDGKVGETVGAKWKNKKTIRTYTKPSNPNTQAQRTVRSAFKSMTSFIALFADQIKYLTALNTSGMSVRNAIIKLNKSLIENGSVDFSTLIVSKGGLQKPVVSEATVEPGTNNLVFGWTPPTATNFTEDAKAVVVIVDVTTGVAEVITAQAKAGAAKSTLTYTASDTIHVFVYYLDKRGNAKVASDSVHMDV